MKGDLLLAGDSTFFSTREYALANNLLFPSASRTLNRLARKGMIVRVTKGIWANTRHPFFHPLGCVPFLLGREQGYISFLTALHRHGVISQIPPNIQIATTGHSRCLKTPIGTFEFLQLHPRFMKVGVEWSEGRNSYRMASPEKALIDTLYLSTRKGRRFASLPEFDAKLEVKTIHRLVKSLVPAGMIRESVLRRLRAMGLVGG